MNSSNFLINTLSSPLKPLPEKYPSIKKNYEQLSIELSSNPLPGMSPGRNCYKISLNITSKKRGKSGGARVITFLKTEAKTIPHLNIDDKAERASITSKELTVPIKKQYKHVPSFTFLPLFIRSRKSTSFLYEHAKGVVQYWID